MSAATTAVPAGPADRPDGELRRYRQYVDGAWVDALDGAVSESEDPTTGRPWAVVPDSGPDDVDRAVGAAARAFAQGPWPALIPQQRARLLRRLGDLCAEHGPRIAALETRDNGKLVAEQALQWALVAELFHYWAGWCDKLDGRVVHRPLPLPTDGLPLPEVFAYTRREPVGVVAAITPWNSPSLLLAWKLGPALAAGCTVVVKPSEHTPVSTLELAALVDEAGFPPGVVNVVVSSDRGTGAALVRHPAVAKIVFTGSTATGRAIARSAADGMKRVTTELGGKSAALVFADADLPAAVAGAVSGIFAAAGQSCMAASRLLVERSLHDAFVEALTRAAEQLVVGDPADPATQVGPIANRPNHAKVLDLIEVGRAEGARLVTGGPHPRGGLFVAPTVFADVHPSMRIAQEEIFGPVAAVVPFDTEDEAVAIADGTPYGLAAAVFTTDAARGHRVAHRLHAGTVWINSYRLVSHLVPFGGRGLSGVGREGGAEGIDAYLETKAVWVPTS
jgi:aldehyde dehydrogenase (NAD+)